MGCGFCQIPLRRSGAGESVAIDRSDDDEIWAPRVVSPKASPDDLRICPGAIMDMPAIASSLFGREPPDPVAGEYRGLTAGYAADPDVRQKAASGGVTTALLMHLFETAAIGAAYCTAGLDPRGGEGRLVRSKDDLDAAMGSHYHPVNFGAALSALAAGNDRFAFVGLPCEVAAMRQLMAHRADIAARCVVLIGLFCGGINRFSGIAAYLRHFDVATEDVAEIDYRDGLWPGRIRLVTRQGQERLVPRIMGNSRWNILRYVISFQGYWMLPRCRICPDQIADFADIAVGDPHLPRFKREASPGYSAIVARTEVGERLLDRAIVSGAVQVEPLSRDELVRSQGYTLENRRQALVYVRVARWLGFDPPAIATYRGLDAFRTWHQTVYAFVDLAKIRYRHLRWLRPFYLPIQIFEYLFLTLSPRLVLSRFKKLVSNK